jgi:hypothetical protein
MSTGGGQSGMRGGQPLDQPRPGIHPFRIPSAMSTITLRDLGHAMRCAAWYRAKGELKAMLQYYFSEYYADGTQVDNGFAAMDDRISRFIAEVEDNL